VLGSWIGLAIAQVFTVLIAIRAVRANSFSVRSLPAIRVRWRPVAGLW